VTLRGLCRPAAILGLLLGLLVLHLPQARAAGRVDAIRARGHLTCGIRAGIAGFAEIDEAGHAHGFEIDLCRAVATAILGSPDAIRFVEAGAVTDFATAPDLDLVMRRLTWTLTREGADGLIFGPIVFYDGQGFLVPAGRSLDLGQPICVDPGEDWARNLRRYGETSGRVLSLVVTLGPADSLARLIRGDCAAYSADRSMLAAIRSTAPDPARFGILDRTISREPLAPLMREGDDAFFQIVRWTIFALIDAEELGVTSANAAAMRSSRDPDIAALLGGSPGGGAALGLPEDWAYRVIAALGNYGEIFARDLGAGSPITLDRGLNRLWTEGGLMYAPPLR
jgi:general L-amino acid transport system substrate-binding protein